MSNIIRYWIDIVEGVVANTLINRVSSLQDL